MIGKNGDKFEHIELNFDNVNILVEGEPSEKYIYITYFVYENGKEIQSDDVEIYYENKNDVKNVLRDISKLISVDGPIMNEYIRERLSYK